jgi:hypothetical protein
LTSVTISPIRIFLDQDQSGANLKRGKDGTKEVGAKAVVERVRSEGWRWGNPRSKKIIARRTMPFHVI